MSTLKTDLVGRRSGMLVVLSLFRNVVKQQTYAVCRCDCGRLTKKTTSDIKRGKAKSCGCSTRRLISSARTKHGKRGSRAYMTWIDMLRRCGNPSRDNYHNYGGRGIRVCERWMLFENFLSDMGEAPAGMTIDRYPNNDGNYEPGNCRWATAREQCSNMRRSRYLVVGGERLTISQAAEKYGVGKTAIKWRLDHGWTDDRAVRPSRGEVSNA